MTAKVIPFQRGAEIRASRARRQFLEPAPLAPEDERRVVLCFDDAVQKGNLALMLAEELAQARASGAEAAEVLDCLCVRLFGVGAIQIAQVVERHGGGGGLLLGPPKGYDE